jgi:5-methylcytosine-specific restriction protein A
LAQYPLGIFVKIKYDNIKEVVMKIYRENINIDVNIWNEIIENDAITNEKTLEILICLLNEEKCEASGGEIAHKLNYSHHAPLNKIISDFSKKIIKNYSYVVTPKRENGNIRYWHIPFLGTEEKEKFTWKLRNELKEALIKKFNDKHLNIKLPEEYIEEISIFHEGKQNKYLTNIYERNSQAREACLKYYGYKCIICGFDFEKKYGEIGKGIIHVHHLNKISEINGEHEIDPINELVPVCPNCHTVIHSKRDMYTIDEMKKIINE